MCIRDSYVIAEGKGSARDTLTALDTVVAAGGIPSGTDETNQVLNAIVVKDPQAGLVAVQHCLEYGLEPRTIGESLLASLRNCFLGAMGVSLSHVTDSEKTQIDEVNAKCSPADLTEALETLGQALVDMRQAADPRVSLEVALLKLTRKEQPVVSVTEPVMTTSADPESEEKSTAPKMTEAKPAAAKPAAAKPATPKPAPVVETNFKPAPSASPVAEVTPEPATEPTSADPKPVQASGDLKSYYQSALEDVSQKVRVRFKPCTYVGSSENAIQLSSPNEVTESRCIEIKGELEQSLERLAGRSIAVEFVASGVTTGGKAPSSPTATQAAKSTESSHEPEVEIDLTDLEDADSVSGTSFDRVKQVFPGAKVVNT